MHTLSVIQQIVVWVLPILFAVTVHEVAHGWVANKLGDTTALRMGRLTLNPIPHIDLIGTVLVPLICLIYGGIIFGWAKPVPVNWFNLRNPRRDAALVAAAGPFSNLLMAIFWALIAKVGELLLGPGTGLSNAVFLVYMGQAGIAINLMLMVLNLVPIPPLDGSRVISSLLPPRAAYTYNKIEPYGFLILAGLILSNVLTFILMPPLDFLQRLMISIFSL